MELRCGRLRELAVRSPFAQKHLTTHFAEHRRGDIEDAKPSTAVPLCYVCDAAVVVPLHNPGQPRHRESLNSRFFALDADPSATHLVRHRRSSAASQETIE